MKEINIDANLPMRWLDISKDRHVETISFVDVNTWMHFPFKELKEFFPLGRSIL